MEREFDIYVLVDEKTTSTQERARFETLLFFSVWQRLLAV